MTHQMFFMFYSEMKQFIDIRLVIVIRKDPRINLVSKIRRNNQPSKTK